MPDLVSVIVPAYNAASTLGRCIGSLLKQTYSPLEIVIVDDGSTDGTEKIGRGLARGHCSIVFCRQENKGVSAARNKGLEMAGGRWVAFCDSDDYVDKNYIKWMVGSQRKHQSDWVIAGHQKWVGTRGFVFDAPYREKNITEEKIEAFVSGWYKNAHTAEVWGALYSHDIIKRHGIAFPQGVSHGEDTIFNIRYVSKCKRISILPKPVYMYVDQENSLTKSFRGDIWENQGKIFSEFKRLCVERGYQERTWKGFFVRGITLSFNVAAAHKWTGREWEKLCGEIRENKTFKKIGSGDVSLDWFASIVLWLLKRRQVVAIRWLFQFKLFLYAHAKQLYYLIRR